MEQASQEAENEAQAQADERKMKFMEYEKILEEQLINAEYDRKEDIEEIKGQFNILSYGNEVDANDNGIPDGEEIIRAQQEREKIYSQERMKQRELQTKERIENLKQFVSSQNAAADRISRERIEYRKMRTKLLGDRIKARAAKKNKTAK